jgi:hypothetical protein
MLGLQQVRAIRIASADADLLELCQIERSIDKTLESNAFTIWDGPNSAKAPHGLGECNK